MKYMGKCANTSVHYLFCSNQIIRNRKSKKRQYNGQMKTDKKTIQWPNENRQKDKQWSTKYYSEYKTLSNTNSTKISVNSCTPEAVPAPYIHMYFTHAFQVLFSLNPTTSTSLRDVCHVIVFDLISDASVRSDLNWQ